jgi:ABC-2 type transport system ATP-binding protein
LHPEIQKVTAVNNVSLQIERGESVAFIGPNGAGKSTTIKMLCGILQPSKGDISVLGFNPLKQRRQLAYQIGTVFGQRSQLIFNLPLIDSLKLSADMYGLERSTIAPRIKEVTEQFNLSEFVNQPVRKLSLGQRMRAEIANSLLHEPEILFLDEPTIGLDVVAKRSLREVIRQTNKEKGTTIFLTSHDVGDIEEVSDRTIIVNHGQIMLDTPTDQLKQDYLENKTVRVVLKKPLEEMPTIMGTTAQSEEDGVIVFSVDTSKHKLKNFLPAMLETVEVADMTIEDTPLEDIIHELYVRQEQ